MIAWSPVDFLSKSTHGGRCERLCPLLVSVRAAHRVDQFTQSSCLSLVLLQFVLSFIATECTYNDLKLISYLLALTFRNCYRAALGLESFGKGQ